MNQNNKIFIAASLANGASFSMILPMLAPLVRKLRLSELQAGAMVSIGALLMAIAAIYISKHQQKYSIFQLLSIGFVGMAVTWGVFTGVLMYGLAAHLSLFVLFTLMISRASTGLFMAMPQIALQTYVMTRYGNEQARAQSMSKFGALNSVGVVFGPLLTTLLLSQGMLAPLWAAILILAGISAVIVFTFDREETAPQLKLLNCKHQQLVNLQDGIQFSFKQCFSWLLLGFSLYLAIVTLNLTAGFYIQDHFKTGIAQGAVSFAQCSLIVGISLVAMQSLISKYLQWPVQRLLWVGLIIMLTGLLISVTTQHLHIFQAAYVLYGISVACLIPAFTTGAAQTAPQAMQAKIASLCTATQALSFVAGPLISTGLYQWHSAYPYYFLIFNVVMLMAFLAVKALLTNAQPQMAKE
ncbi:hypothetical protein F941_01450 [Acinetobacter bouvetii DSM 14964 = CIP 107468]|uniref:Major facilitator superfamily (MFS) profile domain-containing protein n=1 Tax=Acinetobacter bouvetii DSM 14964 = CIP 107468 TaxID=1120925 RepID=N9DPR0_9GAMM|nr:MFS transporter [Acinetobacter bouvetii]ENV82685.1 hypothetical protein F941_01450 [Acinetobacter bouvetii DSM 14964 = CIP 107468]BCU64935.1 hypothetical protein ACBO_17260 [Acinetobacter bouvetii]